MNSSVVYILAKQNVEVFDDNVQLKDIADIYCDDITLQNKIAAVKVYKFKANSEPRAVISIMDIIKNISNLCPGITVESLGETDVIVEKKTYKNKQRNNNLWEYIKISFVSAICFLGTAFSIMAYHNDVGIKSVFKNIYRLVTNRESTGFTELEISYSIGLTIGIILFYNHIGKWRISNDPTPLEVEMRVYERDVNQAIVDMNSRESKK